MNYKKFIFGETAVYYAQEFGVGLAMYPASMNVDPEKLSYDNLVQVSLTGDEGCMVLATGVTMHNRSSAIMSIVEQTSDEKSVVTLLTDGKENYYTHTLTYSEQTGVFCIRVRYENRSEEMRTLEMLETVSLSGIAAPSGDKMQTCGLKLHRMTSTWSRECRMREDTFSQLGMEMSWNRMVAKCEKWGQVGGMPNRGWYPFAAVEAPENGVVWGVHLQAPGAWQMELYQEKETCSLCGGLVDYDFGHWRKNIAPGESFETNSAYVCVKQGSVLDVCNAFIHEQDIHLQVPAIEEDMPVMFNEYCMTWGCPSEENILALLQGVKQFPVKYFAIDAGWYMPDNGGWFNATGDWEESKILFPHTIKAVTDAIRAEGMIPGIWFEFELAGSDSKIYPREDMMLKKDGKMIGVRNRHMLDLRTKAVEEHLSSTMLDFLVKNNFGYIKIDYNETYGIGVDGAESYGEGARQISEASLGWLDKLKNAVPGIVIENCASGGCRIEPKRMSMVSMCSFSDAHECAEIPLVAANVSRVVPARQSLIWAVLRASDTPSRTIYTLTAAMLGRICLSGEVINMPPEKVELVKEGLDFYEQIKHIVRNGDIRCIDCNVDYYRNPVGRQIYVKDYGDERLVIVHQLDSAQAIKVAAKGYTLQRAYTDLSHEMQDGTLCIEGKSFTAGAFLLKK